MSDIPTTRLVLATLAYVDDPDTHRWETLHDAAQEWRFSPNPPPDPVVVSLEAERDDLRQQLDRADELMATIREFIALENVPMNYGTKWQAYIRLKMAFAAMEADRG